MVVDVVDVIDAEGDLVEEVVEVVEVDASTTSCRRGRGGRRGRGAAAESPFDRPGRWYVVHTYSGYENKVKGNLENIIKARELGDRIHEIVVPMEDVVEFKNGKKVTVSKKVFPGLPARPLHPVGRRLVRDPLVARRDRVRGLGLQADAAQPHARSSRSCT